MADWGIKRQTTDDGPQTTKHGPCGKYISFQCEDLYPEAIAAYGNLIENSMDSRFRGNDDLDETVHRFLWPVSVSSLGPST